MPLRCHNPRADTKHEALALMRDLQTPGHLKKCAHLEITSDTRYGRGPWIITCEENSFHRVENMAYKNAPDYTPTKWAFHGCPEGCLCFGPEWKGKIRKFIKERRRTLRRWWGYFTKLSSGVQVSFVIGTALVLIAYITGKPIWDVLTLLANLVKNILE